MVETIKLIAGIGIMGIVTVAIIGVPIEIADLIVLVAIGVIIGGIGMIVEKLFSNSKSVEAQDRWINHPVILVIIGVTTGLIIGALIGNFIGDRGTVVGGGIGLILGAVAALWELLNKTRNTE